MALSNIFSLNKKKPLYGNQSTNQYTPANSSSPTTKFGQEMTSGNGLNAMSSALFPKYSYSGQSTQNQSQRQPQNSSTVIQGSGMTSQYASNPTNYQAPKPTQTQAPAPTQQKSDGSQWINYASGAAKRQQDFAAQQRQQQQDFINKKYQLANENLRSAMPAAQEQFNTFKGNTEATIADLLASGERQKSQAQDYQGEAQRQAAQTLRDTQGMTQRTFSNLGTVDSTGEGSFAQANENTMSDFNRFTQQGLKALADKKAEIDSTVASAERDARATITQEEAKLNELYRNIQYALQNNDLNQAQELTQAFNESQQYIYDIEDALAQTKYQFALQQQELDNELAKINSFTPEFMTTGVPTNQAEYEFFIKNQDTLKDVYGDGGQSPVTKNAVNAIDQLLSMDTNPITGALRLGGTTVGSLTGSGQEQQGLYDQIRSLLTLDNISMLKGTGQISDKEQEILQNAATRIRPGMGDAEFRNALTELKNNLAGVSGASGGSNTSIRVVQNSTGQTGTIQASEFDPSLYTRI